MKNKIKLLVLVGMLVMGGRANASAVKEKVAVTAGASWHIFPVASIFASLGLSDFFSSQTEEARKRIETEYNSLNPELSQVLRKKILNAEKILFSMPSNNPGWGCLRYVDEAIDIMAKNYPETIISAEFRYEKSNYSTKDSDLFTKSELIVLRKVILEYLDDKYAFLKEMNKGN